KEHIEKNRTGRKRLLTLVSISQDDDINIGEIKEKIRELQQQAKRLESKLKVLQQNVFEKEKKQQTKFVLEDALHYYITGKCKELRVEDKQKILRVVLQEVEVIDPNTIT